MTATNVSRPQGRKPGLRTLLPTFLQRTPPQPCLPHTTRAALTGLRKRGFPVAIDRSDKQRGSTYRVRMDRANVSETEATGEDPAQLDEPPAAKSGEAERLGAVRAPRAA